MVKGWQKKLVNLERTIGYPPITKTGWFSVGICKYKPGYKSHDLLQIQCSQWLKLQHSDWRANLVKDSFEINFTPMRALEL